MCLTAKTGMGGHNGGYLLVVVVLAGWLLCAT